MQGWRDTNVPTLKMHSNSRNWLVGIPEKTSPTSWWSFFSRPKTMEMHKVPEHLRSAGMYCLKCRKLQPFSDQCAFCSCTFSGFAVIKPDTVSQNKRLSNDTVPPVIAKQGIHNERHGLLHTLLAKFATVSLRTRTMALGVSFLLLISLAAGIVNYQNHMQRQYSQNFVLALYVIKSGMNLGEMICNGTFNAWRGVESSTAADAGEIDPQAVADLESVNAEINRVLGTLGTPPAEYRHAAQILQKLYTLYEKTNSMVINSPGSVPRNMAAISAAREEFSREIGNLKASMPAPLAKELKRSGQKYDLRFITLKK